MKKTATIDPRRCVACGACETICPKEAVKVKDGCIARVDETLCVGCGKCEKYCPACAIQRKEREAK